LWGTLGWIAVGWGFGFYLNATGADVGLCLVFAGAISILMAVYSLALPHTPPPENPADPLAFMGALRLLKNRSFAVLVIVSFLVATELQFYYVLTPAFFNQGGGPYKSDAVAALLQKADGEDADIIDVYKEPAKKLIVALKGADDQSVALDELEAAANEHPDAKTVFDFETRTVSENGGVRLKQGTVPIVMTFGQICEMLLLFTLPFFLKKLGFRLVITLGILAWSVRYFIFAWCPSPEIVIASQTLHGFGFAFFFVGGFIYGDRLAGKDIKASAQALLVLVTMGLGMLVSSLVAGPISDYFERNWHKVFLVPAILTAVCTVIFFLGFKDTTDTAEPEAASA
jgi:Na+/melibiose symporter-like transporter